MHWNSVASIGITEGRRPIQFGMAQSDRLFHVSLLGQTGTGKSTLLLNLMRQDLAAKQGFCLLDPHGDLARTVGEPTSNSYTYWDVSDPTAPYGYNPLTNVSEPFRPLVASGLIDTLKHQWADAWGPRMEHLLRYALLALLGQPNASLRDILPMYLDKNFRRIVLETVRDEQVCAFWEQEFPVMNYKSAADGVAPIANKLGGFLAHPVVRKAVCEPEQPLRFRKLMDEGQTLIVNLAKGRLGADVSNLLGGLIATSVAHAAYTRQDQPETARRPFFLYLDEFASFTTESLASMLAELRKYGVGLVLAGQTRSQANPRVFDAILGNVGTQIVFRLGAQDAPLLAKQLGGVDPKDIVGLPNYRVLMKMMVRGEQTKAFSATTLPVPVS